MNATPSIDSKGAYPIRIAARLAHLAPKTVTRWVEGNAGVLGTAWTISPNLPPIPDKGIRLVTPPNP